MMQVGNLLKTLKAGGSQFSVSWASRVPGGWGPVGFSEEAVHSCCRFPSRVSGFFLITVLQFHGSEVDKQGASKEEAEGSPARRATST